MAGACGYAAFVAAASEKQPFRVMMASLPRRRCGRASSEDATVRAFEVDRQQLVQLKESGSKCKMMLASIAETI